MPKELKCQECVALSPHGLSGTRCASDSRQAVCAEQSRKAFFEKQKMLLGTFNIYLITTKSYPQGLFV